MWGKAGRWHCRLTMVGAACEAQLHSCEALRSAACRVAQKWASSNIAACKLMGSLTSLQVSKVLQHFL